MNSTLVSDLLNGQTIVPVVVVDDAEQALGLSAALLAGGIHVIEITLRNDYGVNAISKIKTQYPEMLVLAGTVNTTDQVKQVVDAGVDGIISPGITVRLLEECRRQDVAYLPGVATASEIMLAMEQGLSECKLFPAKVVGGIDALKAFAGPFPKMSFCPTGGIGADDFKDFLALPNVMCVGGSWLAPSAAIRAHDWNTITALCKTALAN